MRDYGIVSPKFWTGDTGKQLRKDACAQVLALYLMTSPHATMIGVYYCPIMYMAHETGLGMEGATKALARLIEMGFCTFDEASETVFVVNMAAYQIGEQLDPKDKRVLGIRREVEKMPAGDIKVAFLATYSVAFHLVNPSKKEYQSEAPSKPLPSQDQKQDQEQDQEQDKESAAAQRTSRPRREEIVLKTYLEDCRKQGSKAIPDDHPVREYCRDAGIADEMLQVAWCVFRDDYLTGTNKAKRYKDWPGHFHNAVRGCWAKLWYTDGGEVKWSSVGLQAKQVLENRMRAKEAGNAA